MQRFKEFLESDPLYESEQNYHLITFSFIDNLIPDEDGNLLEIDEFLNKYTKISVQNSQHGIKINLPKGATTTEFHIVPNTQRFVDENPEGLFGLFVSLLKKNK